MRNIPMDPGSASSQARGEQMLPVANATVPYWRTELHPIDEHRSTKHLPSQSDIVIIGAGLSGVCTAYHLNRLAGDKKPAIVLLEARQVGSGATGRNGGHIKEKVDTLLKLVAEGQQDNAQTYANFTKTIIRAIQEAVEREGLDCEWELRRSFDIFIDDAEAEQVAADFRKCSELGYEWTKDRQLLTGKLAEQVTSIKGVKTAVSGPAASYWPYKFITQLLAKLVTQNAVNLQTNTPVTSVQQNHQGNSIITTNRGIITANEVVFATNGWTSGILPLYTDTIAPYKGSASHIKTSKPVHPHLSHTYNISYPPGPAHTDYLNPRPDGGIIVGGGKWKYEDQRAEWYGNWDDSKLLPGAKEHFDDLMQTYFHGWEESGAEIDHIWTGIMATTPDGTPHVGEVPGSKGRQYVLAGHNGGGNSIIYLAAKGLAERMLKGASFEITGLPRTWEARKERMGAGLGR